MTEQLYGLAGAVLVVVGIITLVASFFAVGEADTWDQAPQMAAEALVPARRVAMTSSVIALAVFIPAAAGIVGRLHGTPGFVPAAASYAVFAVGACLFLTVLGLMAIAMPALGELAATGSLDVQPVADAFTRQPPIIAAFLGANAMYLAWVGIAFAVSRSGMAPGWLPWAVALLTVAGWLRFLHVPGFQQVAGPAWPLAIGTIGAWLWWVRV